jgi:hypothetical protein
MSTCRTCPHFSPMENQCRKDAPTAFLVPTPKGVTVLGTWPSVSEEKWCGEHPVRKAICASIEKA